MHTEDTLDIDDDFCVSATSGNRLPLGITSEQHKADRALLKRVKTEWREEGIL